MSKPKYPVAETHLGTALKGIRESRKAASQSTLQAKAAALRAFPHKRPKCDLHAFTVRATREGYPAETLVARHQDDVYLPFWLEATQKCGVCETCALLGDDPKRSQLGDMYVLFHDNPELVAAVVESQQFVSTSAPDSNRRVRASATKPNAVR